MFFTTFTSFMFFLWGFDSHHHLNLGSTNPGDTLSVEIVISKYGSFSHVMTSCLNQRTPRLTTSPSSRTF